MRHSIDELLIILSLDCFTKYLWEGEKESEIAFIKNTARQEFKIILDGEDNYFMNADFSPTRLKKTQDDFYEKISESLGEIKTYYIKEIQNKIEEKSSSNIDFIITSILSNLLWLTHEEFSQPIDYELLEIISKIDSLGISIQETEIDREEIKRDWTRADSEWDLFMKKKSMFEDIDNFPCLILYRALKINPTLKFIEKCHENLQKTEFFKIINFVILEIEAQEKIKPNKLNEIAKIYLERYI